MGQENQSLRGYTHGLGSHCESEPPEQATRRGFRCVSHNAGRLRFSPEKRSRERRHSEMPLLSAPAFLGPVVIGGALGQRSQWLRPVVSAAGHAYSNTPNVMRVKCYCFWYGLLRNAIGRRGGFASEIVSDVCPSTHLSANGVTPSWLVTLKNDVRPTAFYILEFLTPISRTILWNAN